MLNKGLRDALLSSPSNVAENSIEFPSGEQYGYRNGNYLGQIVDEFNAAELVDKIMAGEFVEKLPDDRREGCPLSLDRIAGSLSDSQKPVSVKQVRYLRSAHWRNVRAWIFKVSRSELYAVVAWPEKGHPEIQLVG